MVSIAAHRYILVFVVYTKINGCAFGRSRDVLRFGISKDQFAYTDLYGLNNDRLIDNCIFDVSMIFYVLIVTQCRTKILNVGMI